MQSKRCLRLASPTGLPFHQPREAHPHLKLGCYLIFSRNLRVTIALAMTDILDIIQNLAAN